MCEYNYDSGLKNAENEILKKINNSTSFKKFNECYITEAELQQIFCNNNFKTIKQHFPFKYIDIQFKYDHINFGVIYTLTKKNTLDVRNEFDLVTFFLEKKHLELLSKSQLESIKNQF